MDLFRQLEEINRRPACFARYTAADLWTDEYTSAQMLSFHLDGAVDISSRKTVFIERSAAWMIARFGLGAGKAVADFGCGPGLYATRLAKRGANVTGIDFSRRSIEYAKEIAVREQLKINNPTITKEEIRRSGGFFCSETRAVLSDAILAEFETPYLRQLHDEFGNLGIHSCGEWVRHFPRLLEEGYCERVDFGHPECNFHDVMKVVGGRITVYPTTNVSNSSYRMPPQEWYADIFRGIAPDSKIVLSVPYADTPAFNAAYQQIAEEGGLSAPLSNVGMLEQ